MSDIQAICSLRLKSLNVLTPAFCDYQQWNARLKYTFGLRKNCFGRFGKKASGRTYSKPAGLHGCAVYSGTGQVGYIDGLYR